jgi:hypothetical protein
MTAGPGAAGSDTYATPMHDISSRLVKSYPALSWTFPRGPFRPYELYSPFRMKCKTTIPPVIYTVELDV